MPRYTTFQHPYTNPATVNKAANLNIDVNNSSINAQDNVHDTSGTAVMSDVNDTGLTPVYSPLAGVAASSNVVDIIFIHGLHAGPKSGWTNDNGVFWPAELLPPEVPSGRVLTWGYDSSLLFGDGHCRARFLEHARMLLRDVTNTREAESDARERAIVWVCHSLGGLVLKQALVMATTDRRYEAIKTATYGAVFLGTPHHGLDATVWGKIAGNIIKITTGALRPGQVQIMDSEVKALMDISEKFATLGSMIQLVTFYETRETRIKRSIIPLRFTVIDDPSPMNTEGEIVKTLETDHFEICKFYDATDLNFRKVMTHIRNLVMDAPALIRARFSDASHFLENKIHDLKLPGVPPLSKRFYGRQDELLGLQTHFQINGEECQSTASIRGLAGIGKTQLLLRYMETTFSNYSSVFWIDCSDPESVKASCRNSIRVIVMEASRYFSSIDRSAVAWKLGLDITEGKSNFKQSLLNDKAVRSLRNWLASDFNTEWLLVLDNWNNPEVIDLQDLFPQCRHGHIIVSSRSRTVPVYGHLVDLKGLNDDDGLNLLMTNLDDQTYLSNGAGYRLLRLLAGIPLAIEQAQTFIRRSKFSMADYIAIFEDKYKEFMTIRYPLSQNRTVFSALEITFEALADASPDIVRFISFLSFLDPNNLWIDLIQSTSDVILSDQDPAAKATANRLKWLIELIQDEIRINVVYFTLAESSLMKEEIRGSSVRMVFHPLVLQWARHRLEDDEQQKLCAEATSFCSLLCLLKSENWRYTHTILSNVKFLILDFQRTIPREQRETVEGGYSLEFNFIAEAFGDFLASQNQSTLEVKTLYERATGGRQVFEEKDSSYPKNKQVLLDLTEKKGILFKRLGDLEKAEEALECCFRERVRLQPKSKKTTNLYNILQKVREQRHQVADAEERIRVTFAAGKSQVIEENGGGEELRLRERMDISYNKHGPGHSSSVEALIALGDYYIKRKLWVQAKECARLELTRRESNGSSMSARNVFKRLQKALDDHLISAVKQADPARVKQALEAGANINCTRERTPLQIAAQLLRPDGVRMMELLLQNGAQIDRPGTDFGSALQAAAYVPWGFDAFAFLLTRGANVDAPSGPWGGTALQAAAGTGSVKMTKLLLDNGASVNKGGHTYFNALQAALRSDRENTARLLLDHGSLITEAICQEAVNNCSVDTIINILPPDIDFFKDKKGKWLQMAAKSSVSALKKVEFALQSGIDVNAQFPGEHGYALQAAASVGDEQLDVVHLLLEKGADVNARGGRHGYALQEACRMSAIEVVKVLVFYGANVNAEGGVYGTALQAATRVNATEVMRFLIDNGANVNLYCELTDEGTALHTAVTQSRRHATIRVLLGAGADVNACGMNGSALQAAVVMDDHRIVRLLLDHGADISIGDGEYGSPLEAAWCLESKSMQALLLKKILTELEEYAINYLKNRAMEEGEDLDSQ